MTNVVKLNYEDNERDHGTGHPLLYHEPSDTIYVGQKGGDHWQMIDNIPTGESASHRWRLGPDGLVSFYDWGAKPYFSSEQKQGFIDALGAEGEHKWDKGDDYDWFFSKVASDEPPIPQDRKEYWKAVTIDGIHHVFPGDTKSHLQHVSDLGRTAHDVSDFWGWNPYMDKWENFNRFKPDYQSVWDDTKGEDPNWQFDFDGPTFAKVARWTPHLATYTEDELPEGLWPYANGGHGFERWEPGSLGKGIVIHDPHPRLLTWKVPSILGEDGLHHGDISGLMNSERKDIRPHIPYSDQIWIQPDGRYEAFHQGDTGLPAQLDPRLTDHSDEPLPDNEWHFGANDVDDYGLSAWGEDFDRGFSERAKNPMSDHDILDLLTPVPDVGVPQKGIRLPSGERFFWIVDDYGFPHHKEVEDALKIKGTDLEKVDEYEVSPDGVVRNVFADLPDWDFNA